MSAVVPITESKFEASELPEFQRDDRSAGLMLARLLIGLFVLLVIGSAGVGYWTWQHQATDTDPYASVVGGSH